MLEIKNFTKVYPNGKVAVKDLSLTVSSGDIFGFIGHNGAGKTTLIRSVVGVLDFEQGEITIDGHSVKTDPIRAKEVTAYIPDNPELYDYLTGVQYLNFIGDMYRVPGPVRVELIQKYAGALELTGDLGGLISSYSHGMKQKLALISALIHSPRLMVLDEPFVGLDPKAVHTLKEIMKELCRQGSAIFFSSHVLDVVEKLCNKIAIIKNGVLVACGETDRVRGDVSLEDVFLELIDNEQV
ncbi:MAG TPA: ABC transporter ATP-binding protein [Clostridiales bacterium]|nr:ABC transporter ATP-binding protein [Clostridiales bacterium]